MLIVKSTVRVGLVVAPGARSALPEWGRAPRGTLTHIPMRSLL